MIIEILYTFFWLMIFCFIIFKSHFFKDDNLNKYVAPLLFLLKILAFTAFYLIYTYYYKDRASADMYKYFDDANYLYECFMKSPSVFIEVITRNLHSADAIYYDSKINHWFGSKDLVFENNHRIIILFNLACRFISRGNIFIHGIIINFFAFIGLWAIYKTIIKHTTNLKSIFILPLFLTPSVLFWGSGLLKEPLLLFFIGLALFFYSQFIQFKKWYYIIPLTISLVCLFFLKSYILIALLIAGIFFTLCYLFKFTKNRHLFFGASLLFLFTITALFFIDFNDNPLYVLQIKQQNYIHLMQQTNATSAYQLDALRSITFVDFIKMLFQAFFVAYFRPFPWELHNNPFVLLSLLENSLIISLFSCFLFIIILDKIKITASKKAVLITICIYVNFIYLLSALVSMNFGALMRYKMPAIVFLLIGIFLLFPPKISEKIEKLLK